MEGTRALGSNGEGDAEAVLSNVVITGFIFRAAKRSMIWIDKPGDILFQDCEFRVCRSLLELFIAQTYSIILTFSGCFACEPIGECWCITYPFGLL